jgi:hypothetical protein
MFERFGRRITTFLAALLLGGCTAKEPEIELDNLPSQARSLVDEANTENMKPIDQKAVNSPIDMCNDQLDIKDVYVVSNVNDDLVCTTDAKHPTIDDKVELFLVIKVEDKENSKTFYFTEAEELILNGNQIPKDNIKRWNQEKYGSPSIKWFKVESTDAELSNSRNDYRSWDHWEEINYAETLFSSGAWKVKADVNPIYSEPHGGKGTMRFKASVGCNSKNLSTPGKESKGKTGIKDNVHRISVRGNTGNETIDWAYAFMNLPYIWASNSPTKKPEDHQSEKFIGADCADYVVAAMRKAGIKINYGGTGAFSPKNRKTEYIVKDPAPALDGSYYSNGKRVRIGEGGVRLGDLILYDKHIGILVKDKGYEGYLDQEDMVLHTLFEPPREARIPDAYNSMFSVVRLRQDKLKKQN